MAPKGEIEPIYITKQSHQPHGSLEHDIFDPDLPQVSEDQVDAPTIEIVCGLQGSLFTRHPPHVKQALEAVGVELSHLPDKRNTRIVIIHDHTNNSLIAKPWPQIQTQHPEITWQDIMTSTTNLLEESEEKIDQPPKPRQLIKQMKSRGTDAAEEFQIEPIINALKQRTSKPVRPDLRHGFPNAA